MSSAATLRPLPTPKSKEEIEKEEAKAGVGPKIMPDFLSSLDPIRPLATTPSNISPLPQTPEQIQTSFQSREAEQNKQTVAELNKLNPPSSAPTAPAFDPLNTTGINPPEPTPASSNVGMSGSQPPGMATHSVTETATQTTKGIQVPKELQDGVNNTLKAKITAEQHKADVEATYAGMQAAALDEYARQQQEQIKQQKTAEEIRKAETEARMKSYDAEVAKFMNEKVDPNQFWENKSLAGKVTAALAVGLGAYGAAMTGTPNFALNIITDAINRDVDAQKANIALKEKGLQAKKTSFDMLRDKFGDERTAEALARDLMLKDVNARVTAIAAKSKSPIIQANAQAVKAGLQEEIAKNNLRMFEIAQDKTVTETKTRTETAPMRPVDMTKEATEVWDLLHKPDSTLKKWKETKGTLNEFRHMRQSGADGVALIGYVAGGGLHQGSVSENFTALLRKKGLFDKGWEGVRRHLEGGEDPELLNALEKGLAAKEQSLYKSAGPSVLYAKEMGARLMKNPDFFLQQGGSETTLLPSDRRNKK